MQITVGAYHSLAVTADGTVFSWGSNSHGQLGRATRSYYEAQPRALRLPASRAGARALGAAAGAFHSVVRLDGSGGEVCAFGDNGPRAFTLSSLVEKAVLLLVCCLSFAS